MSGTKIPNGYSVDFLFSSPFTSEAVIISLHFIIIVRHVHYILWHNACLVFNYIYKRQLLQMICWNVLCEWMNVTRWSSGFSKTLKRKRRHCIKSLVEQDKWVNVPTACLLFKLSFRNGWKSLISWIYYTYIVHKERLARI